MTQEFIRECLDYDPLSGILKWRVRPIEHFPTKRVMNIWNAKYSHTVAGNKRVYKHRTDCKYIVLSLGKYRRFRAHRVIWLWMTGETPTVIDHIDGNGWNNKWSNLRDVPVSENSKNHRTRSDNTTGVNGVYYDSKTKKYAAEVGRLWLGRHDTLDEARAVRAKANKDHGYIIR